MLILTRNVDEYLTIGDDIIVKVMGIRGNQVQIGIEAPRSTPVHRAEVAARIRRERDQVQALDAGALRLHDHD